MSKQNGLLALCLATTLTVGCSGRGHVHHGCGTPVVYVAHDNWATTWGDVAIVATVYTAVIVLEIIASTD